MSGGRWAGYGSAAPLPHLVDELTASLFIAVQLEDVEALESLDGFLELEEPDVFFIGPTDLAASMGLRENATEPRAVNAIDGALHRIVAAGKTAGILAATLEDATAYARLGARYICLQR